MPIDPVNPMRFGFDSLFAMAFVVDRRVRRTRRRVRRQNAGGCVAVDSARMRVHRARTASTFGDAFFSDWIEFEFGAVKR